VERIPTWLLVTAKRLAGDDDSETPLLEMLWSVMQRYTTFRLVLELGPNEVLSCRLIRRLAELDKQARSHNGFVRVCGLPIDYRHDLRRMGLNEVFDLSAVCHELL
jgi:anti-anti-sigma regulatory factor